jgi:hypothetical protein
MLCRRPQQHAFVGHDASMHPLPVHPKMDAGSAPLIEHEGRTHLLRDHCIEHLLPRASVLDVTVIKAQPAANLAIICKCSEVMKSKRHHIPERRR